MNVTVLLFAAARDAAGMPETRLELPAGATAGDAVEALVRRFPPLNAWRSAVRVAVNEAYADEAAELREGDVVALIPPVSGG